MAEGIASFGQLEADATHIKIVEGETASELTALLQVVGKISASVLKVE